MRAPRVPVGRINAALIGGKNFRGKAHLEDRRNEEPELKNAENSKVGEFSLQSLDWASLPIVECSVTVERSACGYGRNVLWSLIASMRTGAAGE